MPTPTPTPSGYIPPTPPITPLPSPPPIPWPEPSPLPPGGPKQATPQFIPAKFKTMKGLQDLHLPEQPEPPPPTIK